MISKKLLPVWYGGGIGNNRNALCGVGHLSRTGFFLTHRIMSTNTLSKEAEIRLLDFFNNRIDPLSMAKVLRLANFNLAITAMSEREFVPAETSIIDSFFWINQLAETLNPYLDVE